jgi:hypothetical protein
MARDWRFQSRLGMSSSAWLRRLLAQDFVNGLPGKTSRSGDLSDANACRAGDVREFVKFGCSQLPIIVRTVPAFGCAT